MGNKHSIEYRTQIVYKESPEQAKLIEEQRLQLALHGANFEAFKKEALEKEASLRDEINRNHQELIRLKTAANVDKTQFLELKKWFEEQKIAKGKPVAYGLIGGKGEGKSTFKWMRGWGNKPIRNAAGVMDGTVALEYETVFERSDDIQVVDTIGLRAINYDSFIKLMALFILKGPPKTMILVTKTDRLASLTDILSNMLLFNYHIVSFRDPSAATRAWVPSMIRYEDLYNLESMEYIQDRMPSCVATHHNTRLREMDTFLMYKGFLMSQYLEVPEWEDYCSDESPRMSLFYLILLQIRLYKEEFEGKSEEAELLFMNTAEVVKRLRKEIL
jgi:hypothetical protein